MYDTLSVIRDQTAKMGDRGEELREELLLQAINLAEKWCFAWHDTLDQPVARNVQATLMGLAAGGCGCNYSEQELALRVWMYKNEWPAYWWQNVIDQFHVEVAMLEANLKDNVGTGTMPS